MENDETYNNKRMLYIIKFATNAQHINNEEFMQVIKEEISTLNNKTKRDIVNIINEGENKNDYYKQWLELRDIIIADMQPKRNNNLNELNLLLDNNKKAYIRTKTDIYEVEEKISNLLLSNPPQEDIKYKIKKRSNNNFSEFIKKDEIVNFSDKLEDLIEPLDIFTLKKEVNCVCNDTYLENQVIQCRDIDIIKGKKFMIVNNEEFILFEKIEVKEILTKQLYDKNVFKA